MMPIIPMVKCNISTISGVEKVQKKVKTSNESITKVSNASGANHVDTNIQMNSDIKV